MRSSIKTMLMSAVEIRAEIRNYLEQIKDESFLKVVHSMLDTYVKELVEEELEAQIENVPLHPDWKAKSKEELVTELKEADEQIGKGEYTTLEDLEKEMEQW